MEDDRYKPLGHTELQDPLPLLSTFEILGQTTLNCSWFPIHRLLSLAPNLTELVLSDISLVGVDQNPEQLVLPHLERLSIAGFKALEWHAHILRCFSTPRLQGLGLPMRSITSDGFAPFLQRSPPLQRFCLDGFAPGRGISIRGVLDLLPSLTHLEISCSIIGKIVFARLFALLAEEPPVLPDLCVLNAFMTRSPSPSAWSNLLHALSGRRHTLRKIKITITSAALDASPDTLAGFQALLADGVDIDIGFGRNLLLV
ncbi:hypothetical protein FB45DRAFT_1075605 [Roridomyces roridus]|uniref:Uncharacterized protein n=1 Tax=Roridomyces roridus TaxID=1738132 RepID=A0AAD7FY36_9AGAR|nr:hypothetical protein FB45DRAFT_1075605 [Roridomyces roridus]